MAYGSRAPRQGNGRDCLRYQASSSLTSFSLGAGSFNEGSLRPADQPGLARRVGAHAGIGNNQAKAGRDVATVDVPAAEPLNVCRVPEVAGATQRGAQRLSRVE